MGYFKDGSARIKFILFKDHPGCFKESEHGSRDIVWETTE